MKCLLIGNFGVGNLGDEALKEYFLQEFTDIDWIVVSAHPSGPNEISRLPGGLRSLLNFRWIKTLSAYRSCDAVVFGGGSLFTDIESVYACILWWLHAEAAFFFRKDVHLAFQGIGPFKTRVGSYVCCRVCRKSTTISVRDSLSFGRVGEWGMGTKCIQSFDPVFSLVEKQKSNISSKNVLIAIPRKNSNDKFTKKTHKIVKSICLDAVRILSMQPDKKSEVEYCQTLASTLDIPSSIQSVSTLNELIQEVSLASIVISERYHGALVALALDKKVEIVSQYEGDKLSTLQQKEDHYREKISRGACALRAALKIE